MKFFRAAEIEIGFVNRSHFHGGRIFGENCHDAVGPFFIEGVSHIEKNRMGAQLRGGAQRHCGVDSETPRLIAAGGYHAARIWSAADDHSFAAKIGTLEQFDINKKRVHIEMKDWSGNAWLRGGIAERIGVLGAESSELWHGQRKSECSWNLLERNSTTPRD